MVHTLSSLFVVITCLSVRHVLQQAKPYSINHKQLPASAGSQGACVSLIGIIWHYLQLGIGLYFKSMMSELGTGHQIQSINPLKAEVDDIFSSSNLLSFKSITRTGFCLFVLGFSGFKFLIAYTLGSL